MNYVAIVCLLFIKISCIAQVVVGSTQKHYTELSIKRADTKLLDKFKKTTTICVLSDKYSTKEYMNLF